MTTRHNGHEYRESGVPGLRIFGTSGMRNFALHAERKPGAWVLVTHRDVNEWPTVRQAKAAAQRIAGLLPWDSADLYAIAQSERTASELLVRSALSQETPR